MRLKTLAAAIGALGLVATPLIAQAANAPARAGSPVGEAEELSGSGVIIGLLALAAVVGAVIIAIEDEDEPSSP